MALLYSPPGELSSLIPDFRLPSVDGKTYSKNDFSKSTVQVYMFICNHCPYVKAVEDRYVALANSYKSSDVQFVGIMANDWQEHPEDAPGELKKRWESKKYGFPYLVDEDQSVAKKFGAVCTPEFYAYDNSGTLAYRGRLDDSWKDASKVQKQELKTAIDTLLKKQKPNAEQKPSMGCSIKWKEKS